MRKLIICAAIVGAMLTSCGGNGLKNVPLKTAQDTLANSIGLLLGYQVRGILGDEKLNPAIIANAINIVLESEKPEDLEGSFIEADSYLRSYLTAAQAAPKVDENQEAYFAELDAKGVSKTESGLYYEISEAGDQTAKIQPTDIITVHYKGTLTDGSTFDSSYDRNEPIVAPLNGLIQGWVEGLQMIGKGGKMKLTIPSNLAYSSGPLAGQILLFELEVLDVQKAE